MASSSSGVLRGLDFRHEMKVLVVVEFWNNLPASYLWVTNDQHVRIQLDRLTELKAENDRPI